MSTSEILAELPRLSSQERAEIMECLWKIEESAGPTDREKNLLNEAQAAFDADANAGSPWPEVEQRLRKRS
jgi:putative addiction module component (TIGR02574 family)